MQVAHFFSISPKEVYEMGLGWLAMCQSYIDSYTKEIKKKQGNKGQRSAPKGKSRAQVLAERKGKGGVANG